MVRRGHSHKPTGRNGWTKKNKMSEPSVIKIPTMAEMAASGESPDVLFWVGCSGSFDDRAKRITKAIAKILIRANVKFAVLGAEESCTGDPAKRAGNEFLFQMQAMMNIQVLDGYEIKKDRKSVVQGKSLNARSRQDTERTK